jgi:hypothetical protein
MDDVKIKEDEQEGRINGQELLEAYDNQSVQIGRLTLTIEKLTRKIKELEEKCKTKSN